MSSGSKWWPPGFRFSPTDEELVLYYLKRKVCGRRLKLPVIGDVDVYKCDPSELPEKSLLKSGDKQWYFFSPRDRKYPNGSRSNRGTKHGYWKATGKDRSICQNSKAIGNKKTLVYYHGRAPKGERTDWVMHEYTLEEQALVNCNNVQDYFALYKVFRKSGPGPKNGEQYGAPFREEEWSDDADDETFLNQNNIERELPEPVASVTTSSTVIDAPNTLPIGDLEDFLLQLSNEHGIDQRHSEFSAYISEIDVEKNSGSHVLIPSSVPLNPFTQESTLRNLTDVGNNCQIAQSDLAYVQPTDNPEVASFSACPEQGQMKADEEFLEIKDFSDLDSVLRSMDEDIYNDCIRDTEGLYDTYFDAPMCLAELGPIGGAVQNPYTGCFTEDETQDHRHLTAELWMHEQGFNIASASESNKVLMEMPESGIVHAGTNQEETVQEQLAASESWFNSALSAFLDSVPSSPAIASENAFISRALERVSSFRTQQVGGRDSDAAIDREAVLHGRRRGNNGGFLFVSFLVGLGAVLWLLTIGAAVKVFKGLWGRVISS
ncbi:NAC domain-containing protein 17-like [Ananas comosus]|uniref:NAC domain-containing protein 17-like n=1 Tax=Ananas comosus TaxID=4615 RepID=A0A6P5FBF0_ANACO|nr:NAC domain-containing protein 17-like [Ananas comosus]